RATSHAGAKHPWPNANLFKSLLLPRLFVDRMPAELWAVLLKLQAIGSTRFFLNAIVPHAGFGTLEPNVFSHGLLLHITAIAHFGSSRSGRAELEQLHQDLGHNARTDGFTTFANREAAPLDQRDGLLHFNFELDV